MASKNFSQVDKAGAAGIWQHFLKEKQGPVSKVYKLPGGT
jgi:hypothetical protein